MTLLRCLFAVLLASLLSAAGVHVAPSPQDQERFLLRRRSSESALRRKG